MARQFNAAIPGQSLTKRSRNYPWERPPEIVDPEEAIIYHTEKLSKPEVMDNVLDLLMAEMPTSFLADLMITGAVSKGIHTIDVGMIILPVINEDIISFAKEAGIPYREDFARDDKRASSEAIASQAVLSELRNTPKEEQDKGFEIFQEAAETMLEEKEEKKGLMAREKK